MKTRSRLALGLVALVLTARAALAAADPCSFFTVADASALLKQPVVAANTIGPEKDEDSTGIVSTCFYRTANGAAMFTIVEFGSAAEAQKQMTAAYVNKQMGVDDAKTVPEPGVGERAYWSVSSGGAAITFLNGRHVVQIGVGGEGIKQPAAFKSALKAVAVTLAGKI
jgi:hypothetical protein